ncbi:MAG: hypothetical protein QOH21_2452, partial [Acidobacteriota bacterium]|nr:hypothetical protein [Acidobacteriota bacterium]
MSSAIPSFTSALTELVPRYAAGPETGTHSVSFGQPGSAAAVVVPLLQLGLEPLVELWPSQPDVLFG